MRSRTLLAVALLCLGGCVTQTNYSGTDTPVATVQYDARTAARKRVDAGLEYLKLGNTQQAKVNFDRALRHDPDFDEVHLALAYYFELVADAPMAERHYRSAIRLNRDNANAANNFGVFLCRESRFDEADKLMRQAVTMPDYSKQASTYENLGLCARKAGWNDKALGYFQQSLNYEPRRSTALLEITELALEKHQVTDARNYLERYHSVRRQSAASLWLGVELEMQAMDAEAARRYGVLLLAKYPQSQQAKLYRTKYY